MLDRFTNDFLNAREDGNLITLIVASALILIGGILLHFLVFRILKKIRTNDGFFAQHSNGRFRTPSFMFFLTVALYVIIVSFAPENGFAKVLKHILELFLIFSVTWLILHLTGLGRDLILRHHNLEENDNLKARRIYTQFKVIQRIINFIVILLAIALALMTFETIRKIGVGLFASAGVAGIILGFAAQKMIGTVLAGFQIAVTQPIRIDDVVIVEGEWGWIEEITLTYVVVRIWDKRRLVVPTTYFIEKPFQNWTRVSADILGTVFIYTDYTVPFNALRKELTRILKNDKNWDGKVNVLQVTNSTEKTVEVRALMSAVDSPTAWELRVNVREKMIEFLQRNFPDSLPKTRLTMEKKDFDEPVELRAQ